ncbi:MAG: GntR family transcriptional regulator [Planctomycetes bacterium]|nr:GntR family transcriptional regulator [Planctomycetota bacterium]
MPTKAVRSIRPRKGNLSARAADTLRSQILRGEFEVGQALREMEICRTLGISRIPLREALCRLEGEGLVEIRPNRGAIVTTLSAAELMEIGEACRLLEVHLLREALAAVTPEVLAAAEALLDELDGIDDLLEWSQTNWRFHTTLYCAACRPLMVGIVTKLRARAEPAMLKLVADKKRRAGLNREHRAILACVRAKRTAKASALLDAHLLAGKDAALRLMAPGQPG